jgi:hypothetical protein
MNSKIKFVVSHLDQQSGPFNEQELLAQWAKGELLPIDYVYDEVKQDWILLSERFPWASSESAGETAGAQLPLPPPLSEETIRRRRPAELKPKPVIPVPIKQTPTVPNPSAEKAKAITLKDGSGELEIDVVKPGELELVIDSGSPLKMEAPFKVTVRPAYPRELVWEVKEPQAVGQDCEILVRAVNETGQPCLGHDETYILHIRGPLVQDVDLPMKDGQAFMKFNHTRAETWSLSLHSPHSHPLSLPEARLVEWRPGPAVRLILDGPREYVAGKPMKVQVRALDAYGNLATTFQGTVNLEVKAS